MAGPIDINAGCGCGDDHPVRAWPSTTPGLAVHRRVDHASGCEESWRITHVPTGLCLPAEFGEPEAAMACAAQVGPTAGWDWTDPDRPPAEVSRRTIETLDAWGATDDDTAPGVHRVRNQGVPW